MNAVVNQERVNNPFGNAPVVATPGASAAAVVQREVAEVQAAMTIAKKFPRDPIAAMDRILNACARPSLAEDATYVYARGGQEVTGASIRLAEQLARDWGNIQCGVMELTRTNGVSECLAYAWDLETNFKDEKRFQVRHFRDTKKGGYAVTDERDIYELVANMGARRKRACILAIIPGDVQEAAVNQCDVTLKTHTEVTPEKIKLMTDSLAPYGVTPEMIEKKIQRRLEAILPAQMAQMRKIFSSLKDGMGVAGDYFEVPEQPAGATTGAGGTQTENVKEKLRGKQAGAAATTPDKPADGYIPTYNAESAIKVLKDAPDIDTLNKTWTDIADDYKQSKRAIPVDVEAVRNERREALQKI